VLYQCLTGHLPFEDYSGEMLSRKIREGKFFPPSKLRPDLPVALEAVIVRAMARERETRFPNVYDLGAALLPFASLRKQSTWSEYYSQRPFDGQLASVEKPKVDTSRPLIRSFLMMAAPAPAVHIGTTREVHQSVPTVLAEQRPASEPPDTRTHEQVAAICEANQPGRPWMRVALAAAVLPVTAGAIIWRMVRAEGYSQVDAQASEVRMRAPGEATARGHGQAVAGG
jgi:serine/threonine protein kinase